MVLKKNLLQYLSWNDCNSGLCTWRGFLYSTCLPFSRKMLHRPRPLCKSLLQYCGNIVGLSYLKALIICHFSEYTVNVSSRSNDWLRRNLYPDANRNAPIRKFRLSQLFCSVSDVYALSCLSQFISSVQLKESDWSKEHYETSWNIKENLTKYGNSKFLLTPMSPHAVKWFLQRTNFVISWEIKKTLFWSSTMFPLSWSTACLASCLNVYD